MRKLTSIFTYILLIFTRSCISFDPLTLFTGAVAGTAVGVVYKWLGVGCFFQECCSNSYIKLNSEGLKRDLHSRLHGQHLVIPTVLNSVKAHVEDRNPAKPLVLSFHGWTGGGKNFVSQIIAQNLYDKKEKSSFVHWFNSEIHFKHEDKIREYKDQLHEWIYHNVSACGRSLFIFDEMDHMPEGMVDVLVPFLGHNTHVDKVDFRKSIFLFLSNTGGNLITDKALRTWKNGLKRKSIRLRDMQEVLELSAYNQKSGFKSSKLVHKQLIDHFVPFLPLERNHVRSCILDEFKRQNITEYSEEDVEDVLNEMQWFPKDTRLYSKSGCKKVSQKVKLFGLG